jgi:hypothetical protein
VIVLNIVKILMRILNRKEAVPVPVTLPVTLTVPDLVLKNTRPEAVNLSPKNDVV